MPSVRSRLLGLRAGGKEKLRTAEGETKDGRMRKQVKARRTYKCYRCNETISPGDLYTKEFLRYGHGDFEVIQLCKGCVSPVLVHVEGDDTAYARTQRDYDEECGFHDE